MERQRIRVGYSPKIKTDPDTGEEKVVLIVHSPEAQKQFEQRLRDGTRRRLEKAAEIYK